MDYTLLNDAQSNALRIVLVGKTGCGKSATANTIIGERIFESNMFADSVTQKCQKAYREWNGKNILVVDTPGFFDTEHMLDTTSREVTKCFLYSSPGPHAVILVLQINRYQEDEQKTFAMIKALFGEKVTRHMIFLFTRKEDLDGYSLSDFIAEADVNLKNSIKECGNRYCAFNNRAGKAEKEAQVQELMKLIESMSLINGYFNDKIYEDVEKRLKQKARAMVRILTSQLEKEIRIVEEEYVNKSQGEKERKIRSLRNLHAARVRNIREEAGQNIFTDIFDSISDFFSFLFFGRRK